MDYSLGRILLADEAELLKVSYGTSARGFAHKSMRAARYALSALRKASTFSGRTAGASGGSTTPTVPLSRMVGSCWAL